MNLEEVLNNKYVTMGISIVLALYATLLGPNLPQSIQKLFSNTIFRILVLFLVVVTANKEPKVAIMLAISFVLTLDYIYVLQAKETFTNTQLEVKPESFTISDIQLINNIKEDSIIIDTNNTKTIEPIMKTEIDQNNADETKKTIQLTCTLPANFSK